MFPTVDQYWTRANNSSTKPVGYIKSEQIIGDGSYLLNALVKKNFIAQDKQD